MTRTVKSAERALLIIELLTKSPEGATFPEVCDRLELPKSSTHALLQTMVSRHHLHLDEASRRYRLGIRLWEAGQAYGRSLDLPRTAEPFMRAARGELDETVQLSVLDGLENVYIAKVTSEQRLVLSSEVGMRLPAYATGLGKVLLASLPPDELDRRLAGAELQQFTDATLTDHGRLRAELSTVRRQGYARDHGEFTEGVFCIAVPIVDHTGEVAAAMSVSVPNVRIGPDKEQRILDVLGARARELSSALGYRGQHPTAEPAASAS